MENPNQEHYNGVKRVLRYVKGTKDCGLLYNKGESNGELIGYSDSNFSGDYSDRKSTSSHIFFFGQMAVTWSSQKHSIVALYSCEAEYIAATTATCQAIWMNRLTGELMHNDEMMVDNNQQLRWARIRFNTIAPYTLMLVITSSNNVLKTRRLKLPLFWQKIS